MMDAESPKRLVLAITVQKKRNMGSNWVRILGESKFGVGVHQG